MTNTTIDRTNIKTPLETIQKIGNGGLSGQPLTNRSTEVIKYLKTKSPSLKLIAVGGIATPEQAIEKLDAGADLVQVYTGLIYEGPAMIKRINKALVN